MPVSVDIGKAIAKELDVEQKIADTRKPAGVTRPGADERGYAAKTTTAVLREYARQELVELPITRLGSEGAAWWEGWGTRLKPCYEPILLVRKPPVLPIARNVLTHGTGGLNIDGCRLEIGQVGAGQHAEKGRWPGNVCLDEEAARLVDEQSGERPGSRVEKPCPSPTIRGRKWGTLQVNRGPRGYDDTGGASRFFYVAKPSRKERNFGLGGEHNTHPTVKPIALCCWLVRLITPPGGLVLDPFAGSGTTGVACILEGARFIGIEKEEEYVNIARRRLLYVMSNHDPVQRQGS